MAIGDNVSTVSAAMMLARVCIGPGLLCLPFAAAKSGILFTPIVLVLTALWNAVSCQMMIRCRNTLNSNCDASLMFSRLSGEVLGSFGNFITDFSLFFSLMGVCTAFQINFAILFVGTNGATGPLIIFCGFVSWLITLVRNATFVAYVSFFGLQCVLFCVVTIISFKIIYPDDLSSATSPFSSTAMTIQLWPQTVSDTAMSVGVSTFSYGLSTLAFPIESSMENKSEFMKAVWLSMAFVTILYIIVVEGIVFLYRGDKGGVQENVLLNLPNDSQASEVARYSMALVCLFTCPLTIGPSASMIEPTLARWGAVVGGFFGRKTHLQFLGKDYERSELRSLLQDDTLPSSTSDAEESVHESSPFFHAVTKFVLVSMTTCLAICVPFFTTVVSLLGCFSISFLCFILPPLQQFLLITLPSLRRRYDTDDGMRSDKYLVLNAAFEVFLILLGSLICSVGTASALLNMIAKYRKE